MEVGQLLKDCVERPSGQRLSAWLERIDFWRDSFTAAPPRSPVSPLGLGDTVPRSHAARLSLQETRRSQAHLTFAMGCHAVVDITQLFYQKPAAYAPDRLWKETSRTIREGLEKYGWELRGGEDAWNRLSELRLLYALSVYLKPVCAGESGAVDVVAGQPRSLGGNQVAFSGTRRFRLTV